MKKANLKLLAGIALASAATSAPFVQPAPSAQVQGQAQQASQQASKATTTMKLSAARELVPTFIGGHFKSQRVSTRWPYRGKNKAQRQRLSAGFMAMA